LYGGGRLPNNGYLGGAPSKEKRWKEKTEYSILLGDFYPKKTGMANRSSGLFREGAYHCLVNGLALSTAEREMEGNYRDRSKAQI